MAELPCIACERTPCTCTDTRRYRVVRFYADGRSRRVILPDCTLAEARAHCQRRESRSAGAGRAAAWFDGYEVSA